MKKRATAKGLASRRTFKYKGRKCFCWLIQCGSIRVAAVLIRWYSDTRRFYSFYDFFRCHCRTFPIHERVCWARNEHRVTIDSRTAVVEIVKRTILCLLLEKKFYSRWKRCSSCLLMIVNNFKQLSTILLVNSCIKNKNVFFATTLISSLFTAIIILYQNFLHSFFQMICYKSI